MANIARRDYTTTNRVEVLTKDHWGLETFVGFMDYIILDVLHEVQLVEDVKELHALEPDFIYHLDPRIPNREVTTLATRVYTLKTEVEYLGVRKDVLVVQNVLWSRFVII